MATTLPAGLTAGTYDLDPSHTAASFSAKLRIRFGPQ